MLPRLPATLVAVLLASAAARADSLLDKPAPDPAVAKWAAGEAPPSWKALDGRCALFELLDPDDLVCQGLVSRTVEIAAKAKERRLVVVSVAVGTGADEEKAREFAKRFRVSWPLGVDRRGETFFAAGNPSLPWYWLIAPDGRVVWEGSPGALDEPTLKGFLDRARLWHPDEITRLLRPAAEAFTKGKYGAAARKADEGAAEAEKRVRYGQAVEGTEAKDAALVRDGVKTIAVIRLGIAERLAKDRFSLDARDMLEAMAAGFAGSEWEGKAKEALDAIAADKRAQAEIQAAKRLREILAAIRPLTRKNVQKALEELEGFLRLNENLRTGERARAEMARLEKILGGM